MSALISVLLFSVSSFHQTAPLPDLVEHDPLTGIRVVYERDGYMDVDTWGDDYEYPVVKPMSDAEIARSRAIIRKAVTKYPPGFLAKRLDKIYVCAALSVDGYEYGATYDRRTLFLVNGGVAGGFDDRFLEQSVHHEFSSVLMYEPESHFPEKAWVATNPPGFQYKGYDQVFADKKSEIDWEEQKPEWLKMGMIKRYSFTSVEEDLNTVAESIFAGGPSVWKQADANPRLLKKFRVAMGFYHSLNAWFTEARFRSWVK